MLTTFNVERYKDPTTITLLKISRQKWKSSHRQWKLFGTWFFSFSTRLHSKSNTLYSLKITEHILKASLDGKCFIIVYDVCIRILKSLQNWVRFYCLKSIFYCIFRSRLHFVATIKFQVLSRTRGDPFCWFALLSWISIPHRWSHNDGQEW